MQEKHTKVILASCLCSWLSPFMAPTRIDYGIQGPPLKEDLLVNYNLYAVSSVPS
jgi:hypothetical protein